MFCLKGRIVVTDGIMEGYVVVENGQIVDLSRQPSGGRILNFASAWIVPGFIDLHTHGVGPYEPVDVNGLVGMAYTAVRFGTTTLLPTGAAMSVEQYVQLGQNARVAAKKVAGQGAKIAGVHLEGPFINPQSSGAMPLSTRRPIALTEAQFYKEQIGDQLKIFTFSPELKGGIELIKYLSANGIVPSLGHSIANGDQLSEFIAAGLSHVVHLFNAFQPSVEKEPGVLRPGLLEHILLQESLTCEFICDLQHVASEWLRIAAKVLGPDRFVAITDSLSGAGLDNGIYQFPDGTKYRISDGVARLLDGEWAGCLAGSVLTMNRAFANLIEGCDLNPALAARYTSLNAARILRIDKETGSIEPGKKADLAVLDERYHPLATFVDGIQVFPC